MKRENKHYRAAQDYIIRERVKRMQNKREWKERNKWEFKRNRGSNGASFNNGKCYTFKGAGRVFWSADQAREEAAGSRVRRFDCLLDAEQWLFAMGC